MEELTINNPSTNGDPEASEHTDWSELDVRSAEVQEIIGRPPHWLVRWGITAFFGVLMLVLLSAWAIKYPEAINAPIRVTAIDAPKTLESKINGKLVRLLIENDRHVEEGEVLAWLESTASHRQIMELSAQVNSMRTWLIDGQLHQFRAVHLDGYSDLGELQNDFQSFEQTWREFVSYLPGGFYHQKQDILEQEMEYTRQLLERLREQKQIQEEDYQLAQQEYNRQKTLADKGLAAPAEMAKVESNLLGRRLPLQQTESAIISNKADQTAKQQQLMELEKQIAEQQAIFLQALNTLKSTIEEWKEQYLLEAPVSGQIIYAGILQENQTLRTGQEIFYIQPENTQFFGEMTVSQNSFGKIREDQRVLIRFSGYPHQEFGSVPGRIDYLSSIPVRDSVFFAKVRFPEGFSTNYGRELTPTDGMRGQAEIITQDMRLLERVYNNIMSQLK
ncbi:HlyD family secretion protein [Fodinibius roseus]|uniref:HlyD family secretion protein n=1 Tax=Fodinibius roseus TaxID=1194090 RepID=A0A1M5INM4_9BACT|nr:HlyD family efflux transporter periplasmic adaptor subunit [Fodinibius roseus]SHG29845.1 HlyD family secretion protein [Fodinibius roseus]